MRPRRLLLAAALCCTTAGTNAGNTAAAAGALAAPLPLVVTIAYRVSEQDAEIVQARVTAPIEQALKPLGRIATLSSSTTHGSVTVDVGFEGGATAVDLAAVRAVLEAIALEPGVAVIARSVELGAPRS